MMTSIVKIVICTCALLNSARAEPLSGRVVDLAGHPISEADVVLISTDGAGHGLSTMTGNDGRFQFRLVPSGDYYIEASRIGFLRLRYDPIVIKYPNELTLNFVLPFDWNSINIEELGRADARISGELRRGSTPLRDVEVCFDNDSSRTCVRTNEIGQYSIEVMPGEYIVTISDNVKMLGKQTLRIVATGEFWNRIALGSTEKQ